MHLVSLTIIGPRTSVEVPDEQEVGQLLRQQIRPGDGVEHFLVRAGVGRYSIGMLILSPGYDEAYRTARAVCQRMINQSAPLAQYELQVARPPRDEVGCGLA
jgi:hypothetical protein